VQLHGIKLQSPSWETVEFNFFKDSSEMEFLDINLTKDSSLLLHATVPSTGFNNPNKNPRDKKTLSVHK